MTQAVHAVATRTTDDASNSTTFRTSLTLAAATLTGAGFAINDEVLVICSVSLSQANTATLQAWRVQYAGATITSGVADPRTDQWPSGANEEHTMSFMGRVNLGGTVGDFTLQNLRAGTSANVTIHEAQITVIKLADLGTENTDWFWNKSTTDVANTTTYSATSRAAITWTPGSVEDWVVLWYCHQAIDSTSVNAEAELMLDAALISGDLSEEGWDTTEERVWVGFDLIPSLAASSHTLDIRTRDDTATAANNHRESAILVFRKAKFTDIFIHEAGTVACAAGAETQVATITSSLSVTQDVLVMGQGSFDINVVSGCNMHIEDAGTPLTPDWASGPGSNTALSNDTTDEIWNFVHNMDTSQASGALDYDLTVFNHDASSRNMLNTKLMVWGMEMAAAGPAPATPIRGRRERAIIWH